MKRRAGFTTVELIIALVVAGCLSASIGTLLRRQQRFYARAAMAVEHRVALRDATSILPAELRALSPSAGDVLAFSDSSLDIRAMIGAGIVCGVSTDGTTLDVAPVGQGGATTLAAFSMTPQPGDVALAYDAGAPDDSLDDAWVSREVASVTTNPLACAGSWLVAGELATVPRLRLRLAAAVSASVGPGAFIHVARRVRYRLYRASAGEWFLGYSEWDGTALSVVQPVSGPFASYSRRITSTGLLLRYLDADGAEVVAGDDVSRITRVEVVARSAASGGLSSDASTMRDAQGVTVRLRNR